MNERSYRAKGHAHKSAKDYDRRSGRRECPKCEDGDYPQRTVNQDGVVSVEFIICPHCHGTGRI